MDFLPALEAENALSSLLNVYYREGEDADTPQETLDAFITYLRELLSKHLMNGLVAFEHDTPIGFVLYAVDADGYPFSERPGMGTIAEISVVPAYREHGLGRRLVQQAEAALCSSVTHLYVCAHRSAIGFWHACGYLPTEDIASNGLALYIKQLK